MSGLNKLRQVCDTTIVVPNDKLLELVPKLPVDAAFKVADEVLMQTIKGLTEIITKPGLVNLDYADIQTVMNEGGVAFVGIGEANTDEDDRVKAAVHEALTSPMLGEIDLKAGQGRVDPCRRRTGHDRRRGPEGRRDRHHSPSARGPGSYGDVPSTRSWREPSRSC